MGPVAGDGEELAGGDEAARDAEDAGAEEDGEVEAGGGLRDAGVDEGDADGEEGRGAQPVEDLAQEEEREGVRVARLQTSQLFNGYLMAVGERLRPGPAG